MLFKLFRDLDTEITANMNEKCLKIFGRRVQPFIWNSFPIYEIEHSIEMCKLQIKLPSKFNQAYSERT